jgi:ABC-type amino acid transport substrate-binding protein
VLVEKAAFDDMHAAGLLPRHALFAGHSLGEYAALSSAVPLLPVPSLVSLVFLRGMVMQGAVPRDASGRSDFGMAAVNPARVGPFFTEPVMQTLVDAIAKHSGCVLEVVNGTVDAWVYDQVSVMNYHAKHADRTRALLAPLREEFWAVGLKKGNDDLKARVNATLARMKKDGTFAKLADQFLAKERDLMKAQGLPFVFE